MIPARLFDLLDKLGVSGGITVERLRSGWFSATVGVGHTYRGEIARTYDHAVDALAQRLEDEDRAAAACDAACDAAFAMAARRPGSLDAKAKRITPQNAEQMEAALRASLKGNAS